MKIKDLRDETIRGMWVEIPDEQTFAYDGCIYIKCTRMIELTGDEETGEYYNSFNLTENCPDYVYPSEMVEEVSVEISVNYG